MKYKARLTKAKTMFLPINLCCRRSDKKRKKKWKVEKWWLIYSFNIRKHRRELMKNRNEQEREEEEEEQEPNTSWSSVSRSRGIRGRPQSRLPELGWRRLGLGADPPPCVQLLGLWSAKHPPHTLHLLPFGDSRRTDMAALAVCSLVYAEPTNE